MDDRTSFPFGPLNRLVYRRVVVPAQDFIRTEVAGGVVILVAAVAALIWANVDSSYFEFWGTELSFDIKIAHDTNSLKGWVNDGLMVLFFFVIGLEIKRELLHGELNSPRKAALPIAAAAGGMIVPALIYVAFNAGGEGAGGWGIPMATDIAFALGVLALVGKGIPPPLRIFLLALAVADDVGAILVIAVFYTESLDLVWLGVGGWLIAMILMMQRFDIRQINPYWVVGGALWLAFLESGVHPTIAGVILGVLTPASAYIRPKRFADEADSLIRDWKEADERGEQPTSEALLGQLEELTTSAEAPLERLERSLVRWTSFVVVPIFALANSGIDLSGGVIGDATTSDVTAGVLLGLLAGKVVGVIGTTWIATRVGIGELPPGVTWIQIVGVGLLAGIGFTVALFITELAFDDNEVLATNAKIGILCASVVAGLLGYMFLKLSTRGAASEAAVE
ncbi:MAG: Na+/H+ antiporter NhaA [Chloroflexi bacterium]|nr:Na+/H+ antiporter NhaA [Chloroflexota bacterium]